MIKILAKILIISVLALTPTLGTASSPSTAINHALTSDTAGRYYYRFQGVYEGQCPAPRPHDIDDDLALETTIYRDLIHACRLGSLLDQPERLAHYLKRPDELGGLQGECLRSHIRKTYDFGQVDPRARLRQLLDETPFARSVTGPYFERWLARPDEISDAGLRARFLAHVPVRYRIAPELKESYRNQIRSRYLDSVIDCMIRDRIPSEAAVCKTYESDAIAVPSLIHSPTEIDPCESYCYICNGAGSYLRNGVGTNMVGGLGGYFSTIIMSLNWLHLKFEKLIPNRLGTQCAIDAGSAALALNNAMHSGSTMQAVERSADSFCKVVGSIDSCISAATAINDAHIRKAIKVGKGLWFGLAVACFAGKIGNKQIKCDAWRAACLAKRRGETPLIAP